MKVAPTVGSLAFTVTNTSELTEPVPPDAVILQVAAPVCPADSATLPAGSPNEPFATILPVHEYTIVSAPTAEPARVTDSPTLTTFGVAVAVSVGGVFTVMLVDAVELSPIEFFAMNVQTVFPMFALEAVPPVT